MDKRNIRRWLSAGLCIILMAVSVGCRREETRADESEQTQYDTLHLYMYSPVKPQDEELVEEEISKITREKLQINVDLETFTKTDANERLFLAEHEEVDLFSYLGSSQRFISMISGKEILALDDLLAERGEGILDYEGEMLDAGKWKGQIYGVPSNREKGDAYGVVLLKSLVDKYEIDVSEIRTWEDLDPVFAIIKEKEKDLTVLVTEINDWSVAGLMNSMDTLTDARFAVLKEGTKVPRVTNYYETQEWNQAVRKAHEWYKKGYIKKDVLTSQEEGRKLLDEGKAFAKMSLMNIDRNGEMEKPEKVYIPLTKTLATTTCASRDLWVIPSASSMPEKAMEMLNLMYTDPDIVNLLQYGIEGVHYTMQEDGTMLHEYNATGKSGYYRGAGQAGNQSLLHVASLLGTDFEERWKEKEENTEISRAFGFRFDPSPVLVEIEEVEKVIDEYAKPLESGVIDPVSELPKFKERLKEAGIYQVIREKQRQLDEWAAKQSE